MNQSHGRSVRRVPLLLAIASAALIGACGGNSHSDATEEVPNSASESVDGFIDYLKRLVTSSADMLEPVDTSGVTAPVDDTREPVAVD